MKNPFLKIGSPFYNVKFACCCVFSCIFVWRICPELTIKMRQRLSDLKENSKPVQKTPPNKQHTLRYKASQSNVFLLQLHNSKGWFYNVFWFVSAQEKKSTVPRLLGPCHPTATKTWRKRRALKRKMRCSLTCHRAVVVARTQVMYPTLSSSLTKLVWLVIYTASGSFGLGCVTLCDFIGRDFVQMFILSFMCF